MKKIAMVLCTSMLLGSIGTTGVLAETRGAEISIFDTFSGYTSEKGGGLPANWMVRRAERQEGIGVAIDAERNSRTVKLRTGAEATLPFDANCDKGKLHISFDAKLTATEIDGEDADYNKSLMLGLVSNETTKDSNQYDYTSIPDGGNYTHFAFNTGNESKNVPVYDFGNSWRWMGVRGYDESKAFTKEAWHKIELFVDVDTKQYKTYLDGSLVAGKKYENDSYTEDVTASFTNGSVPGLTDNFKAVTFTSNMGSELKNEGTGTASDDGGFLIDNIYLKTYDGEILEDSLSIVLDDMTNGGISSNNNKLGIGFSEYLASPAAKSDIQIKNKDTGENVTDFKLVSADNMQCVIEFNTIPRRGTYTLSVNGPRGAVSGMPIMDSAEFYSAGEKRNAATERYYLMDEDFNNFTGKVSTTEMYGNYDIPAGWRHMDVAAYDVNHKYSKNWDAYGKFEYNFIHGTVESSKRAEGDYALKMKKPTNGYWGSNISYYFPKGVASGDFTMELDVKHSNGGWGLALIDYDSFDSVYTQRAYANMWNTATDSTAASTEAMKKNAVNQLALRTNMQFIGMSDSADTNSKAMPPYLGFTDELSNAHDKYVVKNDTNGKTAEIPTNTWTHIKAEINTDNGIYTITITPDGRESQTVLWSDAVRGRFEKGVMGVTLRNYIHNGSEDTYNNTVEFDNIKVYKNDSYLINQNFDSYTETPDTDGKCYPPGGWYKMNEQNACKYDQTKYTYKFAGISSGEGVDNSSSAMKLSGTGASYNETYLRAFSHAVNGGVPVAVEFDAKTSDTAAGWQLHQFDQQDLLWLAGNNNTHHLEDGTMYWTNENNGRQQNCNAIIAKMPNKRQLAFSRPDGAGAVIQESTLIPDEDVNISDGEWVHYQVVITPISTSETRYDIYADTGDGVMRYTGTTRRNSLTNPIAGIGFLKTGSGDVTLDNIKAYEAESYINEYGVTMHREVSDYAVPEISGVEVEYLNGQTDRIADNSLIKPYAKRIAISFTAPIALPMASEVEQPLNYSMTSTAVGSHDLAALQNAPADKQVRYQVYDTIEDVISLTRVMATSESFNPSADVLKTKRYFSADRKTYYIELENTMLEQDKDYILRIAKNISFTTSAYATLDRDLILQFGSRSDKPGMEVTSFKLVRQAGSITVDVENIENLTDGEDVSLVCEGYNETDTAEPIVIMEAKYDSERTLTNIIRETAQAECGVFRIKKNIKINTQALSMFKVFAWNTDMKPYSDCVTID